MEFQADEWNKHAQNNYVYQKHNRLLWLEGNGLLALGIE